MLVVIYVLLNVFKFKLTSFGINTVYKLTDKTLSEYYNDTQNYVGMILQNM